MTPESIKVGDRVTFHPVFGKGYISDRVQWGQILTVDRSDYQIQVNHANRVQSDDIHHFYFHETQERYPTYIIRCVDELGHPFQGFHVRFQLVETTIGYQLDQQLDAEEDLL